jgi:hypothetical protein
LEVFAVTNFLSAGFLEEDLDELRHGLRFLQRLLNSSSEEREAILTEYAENNHFTTYDQLLRQTLDGLVYTAERAHNILAELPSDPLVYTGPGSTSDVIRMLEKLIHEQRTEKDAVEVREVGGD